MVAANLHSRAPRVVPRRFCTVISLIALGCVGCAGREVIVFEPAHRTLTLQRPALYPETVVFDSRHDQFLVGSFREGAIYRVDDNGGVKRLVDDARLCSVLGIALDLERNRVWAVNADLGASAKQSAQGPKTLAAVGVYDLTTGAALNYIELADLLSGPHLLNGIALDAAGNAYVTDSFSPAIYKIDADGQASVLLQDPQLSGEGISLNGLVVHPDGYLLVIKKSDGSLFKVPVSDPALFSKVAIPQAFVGGDGLTLVGRHALLVIANQTPDHSSNTAFSLVSDDGWISAKLQASQPLGDSYPTTAASRDDNIYVIQSKLNELIAAPADEKGALREQATLRQIAKLDH